MQKKSRKYRRTWFCLFFLLLLPSVLATKNVTEYYPEPSSEDTQGIYEFFNYTNYVSGYPERTGIFFPLILLVIWVIVFTATKIARGFSTPKSWTGACLITAFLSMPLTVLGLVAPRWMYLAIVLSAVGIVWLKLSYQR